MQVSKMNVEELIALQESVQKELVSRQQHISDMLHKLNLSSNGSGRQRRSTKGTKVPPKYRGPGGETWAGRGAKPRWLTALLDKGRKLESYRIKA